MKLKYGKYAGCEVKDLDDEYLVHVCEWNRRQMRDCEALIAEAEAEIARRQDAAQLELSVARRILETGYRTMAAKIHPDAGGQHESMVELNDAMEKLRRMVN